MFNVQNLMQVLEEFAPLELSYKMIAKGDYDNSGIIVNTHQNVKGVLFALDLTEQVVNRAKRLKCDTIITHHPAIYAPIKKIDCDDAITSAILLSIKNNLNVISMHLNLDVADNGIDYYLAEGLGSTKCKILDYLDDAHGYGREFTLPNTKLSDFINNIKKTFKTNKIIVYGNKNFCFNKVASFCGAGGSCAEKCVNQKLTDAQVIVSSDMPHHIVKELVSSNKVVIILPHYASELYGFKKFYERVAEKINSTAQTYFFEDKRLL